MLFLLLSCILFFQPQQAWAASFDFKKINADKTPVATSSIFKNISSEDKHFDDDNDDDNNEQFNEKEDDFYDNLKNKTSFRIQLSRSMRTIKKHATIIACALSLCAVGYVYWYKLWPFNTVLVLDQSTEVSQQVDEENKNSLQAVEDLKEEILKKQKIINDLKIKRLEEEDQLKNDSLKTFLEEKTAEYTPSQSLEALEDKIKKAKEHIERKKLNKKIAEKPTLNTDNLGGM
ncbi:MAG TPA: hypothetical protein VL201_00905 [Patescibacteria group bacterium]|jgi:hypothetical protein|nr:hypothetical protein [Patescibacteria group bacterium]